MSLGLKDIDHDIARRFRDKVRDLWNMGFEEHQHPHTEDRERRLRARDVIQQRQTWILSPTAGRWIGSIGIGVLTVLFGFGMGGGLEGPSIVLGSASAGAWYGLSWWNHKASRSLELERKVRASEFSAISGLLTLEGAEKRYCDAIMQMLDLGPAVSRTTLEDILRELNVLLQQSRELGTQRARILAAMTAMNTSELDAELARLEQRLEETEDSVARNAVIQSLDMLRDRVANARTLEPNLERIEAQQEVIQQTFASVQSTLARMKVAPTEIRIPDLEEIRRSVVQVRDQTRAVEEAVQEVMSVTAGS